MSNAKKLKSIRRIKERASEIRQGSHISIAKSLDLAAREHGFRDFLHAKDEIPKLQASQTPMIDYSLVKYVEILPVPES